MSAGKKPTPFRPLVLAVGVVITILIALLAAVGVFEGLELKTYDLRFRVRGSRPPRPDIVLVTIDPATVKDLGRRTSEITRAEHAQVVRNLLGRGANLLVFDMDFASPTTEDADYALQAALADHPGRVVMARYVAQDEWVRPNELFRTAEVAVGQWEVQASADEFGACPLDWDDGSTVDADSFIVFAATAPIADPYAEGVVELARSAAGERKLSVQGLVPLTDYHFLVVGAKRSDLLAGEGAINEVEDSDDRIRRKPLMIGPSTGAGDAAPTLSLAAALAFLWPDRAHESCEFDRGLCFQVAGDTSKLRIPLLAGAMPINFAGPRWTFPALHFSEVLLGATAGNDLAGKIALVGNTHPTAHDEYPTPFGAAAGKDGQFGYTSGLEIHANALQTILDRAFITRQGPVSTVVLTIGLGLLATLAFARFHSFSSRGIALLSVALAGVGAAAQLLFTARGFWLNMSPLLLSVSGSFLGVLIAQTVTEYREKQFLKGAFGMYLAPAVIEQLLDDPDKLALGGDEREMTALFSDIQGFSGISEKLSAKELVRLLNEYLTPMCDAIFASEGTVDKFEGDAIIAFFGAPIHHPDHAVRACRAALDMQRRNEELNRKLAAEGRPQLLTRIGLNSGSMVVGNMGSAQRMDYTIMGDAVNLASRLEGANKQYGSRLMISEAVFDQVFEVFEARELDLITVVGKAKPVRVFELLAEKGALSEEELAAMRRFAEGLNLYRERRWDEAEGLFTEVIRMRGEDPPSRVYIERCLAYRQNPPGPDWIGVFSLQSK